jgi:hypothetical protein
VRIIHGSRITGPPAGGALVRRESLPTLRGALEISAAE